MPTRVYNAPISKSPKGDPIKKVHVCLTVFDNQRLATTRLVYTSVPTL